MAILVRPLKAGRVVFVTQAGGVFDRDPSKRGAKLLACAGRRTKVAGTGQGADATGRMAGKLRHAIRCAAAAPTFIVGPRDLFAALHGRAVGTRVVS